MSCVLRAWRLHEAEMRGWLRRRFGNDADADDVLQELFLKATRQGERFCDVTDARAWLYAVARNAIADRLRVARDTVELPEDLAAPQPESAPVDDLVSCLARVLAEMEPADREAITLCDLGGMSQEDYARSRGLTLPGGKSRVQRARKRLRERLMQACQVRFDEQGHVSDFVRRRSVR